MNDSEWLRGNVYSHRRVAVHTLRRWPTNGRVIATEARNSPKASDLCHRQLVVSIRICQSMQFLCGRNAIWGEGNTSCAPVMESRLTAWLRIMRLPKKKPTSRGRSVSSNPGIPVTVSDTVDINLESQSKADRCWSNIANIWTPTLL